MSNAIKFVIISISLFLTVGLLIYLFFAGDNRKQYKLNFNERGELTVDWHNTSFPKKVVPLDKEAIDFFSSIEFCGQGGDTTPDGWVRIITDEGDTLETGIVRPDTDRGQKLQIQNQDVGLGVGCTDKDQRNFEKFFSLYLSVAS